MYPMIRRIVSVLLSGAMLLGVAQAALACARRFDDGLIPENTTFSDLGTLTPQIGGEYTYKGYATALGNNWNPHTWETAGDSLIQSYTTSPLVAMSILDSQKGIYQWVYEMATSISDVTKEQRSDLTKYKVTLQPGKTADTTESGFVFEIQLNPRAKWEDGTPITADDYIYSMEQLLNSKMRNYRANLYYAGESAVAGGSEYYHSESPVYEAVVPRYNVGGAPDYSFDIASKEVYIHLTTEEMTFAPHSFGFMVNKGYIDSDLYGSVSEDANAYDYVKVTAANREAILSMVDAYCKAYDRSLYRADGSVNEDLFKEFLFYNTGRFSEQMSFDRVGCYKVDRYTIRYVTQTYIDLNYFLAFCTSTWLVKKDLYEANKDTSGELVATRYGTSKDTYASCGPYKIQSLQTDKQIVFTRNEHWYGWEQDEQGNLYSMTDFEVDGRRVQQYQTTKVVINVMDQATAKQAFLKGELTEWSPTASELSAYATSRQLYQADDTYTLSFFFNTNSDALQAMDRSKGNRNSVVLSNYNFRKAMSLAVNRKEFVTATAGYKPAFSLMNGLYHYDIYNDPASSYRKTDEAMQAIVNLYGVEYGEGKAYATLQEAHDSITGYNLAEAKKLMKTACAELVAAGLYAKGQEIKIRIAWAKGALTADDNAQIVLLGRYLNAVMDGSGFGKLTLEGVGNITDRYGDVPKGEYAIGYGAWGGAPFYPFRNFQVYMDPDQYSIHEAGCYDPTAETLTLTVQGKLVTMTWQEWSNSMIGSGVYADAEFSTKLSITAQLEEAFLTTFYRIPLCGMTTCFLLSYQADYYTHEYNIMYGYGGLRLLTYHLSDADFAAYVAKQGGTLNYE